MRGEAARPVGALGPEAVRLPGRPGCSGWRPCWDVSPLTGSARLGVVSPLGENPSPEHSRTKVHGADVKHSDSLPGPATLGGGDPQQAEGPSPPGHRGAQRELAAGRGQQLLLLVAQEGPVGRSCSGTEWTGPDALCWENPDKDPART
jgi:hypothetical protein